MLIARLNGTNIIQIADYKEVFPNTSFSAQGPTLEFLKSNSCLPVTVWKPHDRNNEKLTQCEPYVENDQVYTVAVAPLSEEELSQLSEQRKQENKRIAESLLSQSDWVENPSVSDTSRTPHLTNFEEIMDYRMALRAIAINPPEFIEQLPTKPDNIWSS